MHRGVWLIFMDRGAGSSCITRGFRQPYSPCNRQRPIVLQLESVSSDTAARVNLFSQISLLSLALRRFNPHKGTRFQPSTDEDISAFRSALIRSGMVCTIRDSRGARGAAPARLCSHLCAAPSPCAVVPPSRLCHCFALTALIVHAAGDDEMAACGQLGNVGLSFRPSPILDAPERFRKFLLPPSPAVATKQAATSPAVA